MDKISVKAARVNAGLSQSQMAEILGVTKPTYAKLEKNIEKFTVGKFNVFCQVTGCKMEDFSFPTSQV